MKFRIEEGRKVEDYFKKRVPELERRRTRRTVYPITAAFFFFVCVCVARCSTSAARLSRAASLLAVLDVREAERRLRGRNPPIGCHSQVPSRTRRRGKHTHTHTLTERERERERKRERGGGREGEERGRKGGE